MFWNNVVCKDGPYTDVSWVYDPDNSCLPFKKKKNIPLLTDLKPNNFAKALTNRGYKPLLY